MLEMAKEVRIFFDKGHIITQDFTQYTRPLHNQAAHSYPNSQNHTKSPQNSGMGKHN
jgi:hypothetical protein